MDEGPANPAPAAPLPPMSDSDMDSPPTSPTAQKKKEKKKKPGNSKFATLESLQHESSSEEEEGMCIIFVLRYPCCKPQIHELEIVFEKSKGRYLLLSSVP